MVKTFLLALALSTQTSGVVVYWGSWHISGSAPLAPAVGGGVRPNHWTHVDSAYGSRDQVKHTVFYDDVTGDFVRCQWGGFNPRAAWTTNGQPWCIDYRYSPGWRHVVAVVDDTGNLMVDFYSEPGAPFQFYTVTFPREEVTRTE